MMRLIEKEAKAQDEGYQFSANRLIESLNNYTATYLDENYYMFDYYDENIDMMAKVMEVDLDKRFRTRREIKDMIARTKTEL